MNNIKWYQLLIIGALGGSGITIAVFYLWLKPSPDTDYKVKYGIEKANNESLLKKFDELNDSIIALQDQVRADSIIAFESLNNLGSIKKRYVKIHDSIRHLTDDGDVHFTRSRLPASNPY